jgi:hypothetical protein
VRSESFALTPGNSAFEKLPPKERERERYIYIYTPIAEHLKMLMSLMILFLTASPVTIAAPVGGNMNATNPAALYSQAETNTTVQILPRGAVRPSCIPFHSLPSLFSVENIHPN